MFIKRINNPVQFTHFFEWFNVIKEYTLSQQTLAIAQIKLLPDNLPLLEINVYTGITEPTTLLNTVIEIKISSEEKKTFKAAKMLLLVYTHNMQKMKSQFFSRSDGGLKNIGWLKSHFYLSFSEYYDPLKSAFGTLVAFNDDIVEAGKGFGIHPHANMEIISVLLKGKMNHIDTLGYKTIIEEGGVQIMSAGTGLRHEEYNIGDEEVNFLQIWIQPKLQNIAPRYQQRSFPLAKRINKLQTIISGEEGLGHCWINQNAKLSLGYYDAAQEVVYSLNAINKCLFIFLIEGKITIDGTNIEARDAIGIWDTDTISIQCEAGAYYLIIEIPVNQK